MTTSAEKRRSRQSNFARTAGLTCEVKTMPVLINKNSEIEEVRNMPNSEIEKYIQLAYKRESNRVVLRERILEEKTYKEIIEKYYFCPVGELQEEKVERVIRARINAIQRMETKFYRCVRTNRRKDDGT